MGGAIIAGFDRKIIDEVGQTYPGNSRLGTFSRNRPSGGGGVLFGLWLFKLLWPYLPVYFRLGFLPTAWVLSYVWMPYFFYARLNLHLDLLPVIGFQTRTNGCRLHNAQVFSQICAHHRTDSFIVNLHSFSNTHRFGTILHFEFAGSRAFQKRKICYVLCIFVLTQPNGRFLIWKIGHLTSFSQEKPN